MSDRLTRALKRAEIELAIIVIAVFVVLFFALRCWPPPAHGAEAFDWDRYHARQDACREKDRITEACAKGAPPGYCDELALRQARRACSAFGPYR